MSQVKHLKCVCSLCMAGTHRQFEVPAPLCLTASTSKFQRLKIVDEEKTEERTASGVHSVEKETGIMSKNRKLYSGLVILFLARLLSDVRLQMDSLGSGRIRQSSWQSGL